MNPAIPPLDLLFYVMESHDNPKHVAALQIFELPPKAPDTYLVDLVEKLRQVPPVAPFNRTPNFPRVGIPRWETRDNIEMQYHLRHSALPKPGTMQQLMAVVQRLHAGVLDRARPGWICQVIEGLEGNRFALYCKIHHAYIDGMSGVARIYGSLSPSPTNREVVPLWGLQPQTAHRSKRRAGERDNLLIGLAKSARKQAGVLREVNGKLVEMGMELARLRKHTGYIPFSAPRTAINQPVHSDLRSMGVLTLPLDQLKKIAKLSGCTLNDLVLALTDAALHDYLAKHRADTSRPLVAMCPMSLRQPGDETANTQVATLLIEMGEPGSTVRQRLEQIRQTAINAKRDARELSRDALMDFVILVGGALEVMQRTGLDQVIPQSYNVLVSNVPGPGNDTLYLDGSRLRAVYPISTLTPGNNLNLTVLSHGSSLDFGLLAAHRAMPDIDFMVARLLHHFDELAAELGVTGPATRSKAKRKSKSNARAKPGARAGAKAKVKTAARRRSPARSSSAQKSRKKAS